MTKALQEEFEKDCQPAREAFETVMWLLAKFCEEHKKFNPDSLDMKMLYYPRMISPKVH